MKMVPKWLADIGLAINRTYYRQLLVSQYYKKPQPPAWFDHRIDFFYLWPDNLFWLERGVVARRQMFPGCTVLDLFCGDGFYSRYFYSTIAQHIDAVDRDPSAVEHARKWHASDGIAYYHLNAVKEAFPASRYDVVVWCEGLEHLSSEDYASVAERIKSALGDEGVLVGSTPIVSQARRGMGNWEHQNEFTSTEDLHDFLSRDFQHVETFVTTYPQFGGGERRTAYFVLRLPK